MARQSIKGFKDHPFKEILRWDYYPNPPPGERLARLDYQAWGRKSNLMCFFTELGTAEPFQLNVWRREHYRPEESGPAFDEEAVGGVFRLKIGRTAMGKAKLVTAARVYDRAEMETLCALVLRLEPPAVNALYDELNLMAHMKAFPDLWGGKRSPQEVREAFEDAELAHNQVMGELDAMAGDKPAPSGPVEGAFFWPSGAPPLASKTEPPAPEPAPSNTGVLKSWEPGPGKPH